MENTEEIWKDISGYEGLYQVSNKGNVMSLKGKKPKILKTFANFRYPRVLLFLNRKARKFVVHRLVAVAFIPNPLIKPFVNHKNGIKTDNRVENLEWCTSFENITHAIETGLINIAGENHYKSKLTNEQVLKIRELSSQGMSSRKIATEIGGISQSCVMNIIKKLTWKHI